MPPPARTAGSQPTDGPAHLGRLAFIRQAREFGFGLPAIRTLLDLAAEPSRPCAHAHALAVTQLAEVDAKLRRLAALRAALERLTASGCTDGVVADCRVLEALGDHTATGAERIDDH